MSTSRSSKLLTSQIMTNLPTKRWDSTGFGPNRLYKQGTFFVGTVNHPLKYYMEMWPKRTHQKPGLQGANHLLAGTGKIADKMPVLVHLKKDMVYAWCSCGNSGRQPFCDGNHNRVKVSNDHNLRPVRYIPANDETVWLCRCKQTKNRPFCDGSHRGIQEKTQEDMDASLFEHN